jgi:hypothetical protein
VSRSTLKGCIREASFVVRKIHIDHEAGSDDYLVTVVYRSKKYRPGLHGHFIARTIERMVNASLRDARRSEVRGERQ